MNVITYSELKKLIDSKADFMLVDVREKHELVNGMLPGAVNFPLSELEKSFVKLPKDKLVVVYCRSGGRSGRAAEFLKSKGLNVKNYAGSVQEWSKFDNTVKMY